jgi:hypothetical protein
MIIKLQIIRIYIGNSDYYRNLEDSTVKLPCKRRNRPDRLGPVALLDGLLGHRRSAAPSGASAGRTACRPVPGGSGKGLGPAGGQTASGRPGLAERGGPACEGGRGSNDGAQGPVQRLGNGCHHHGGHALNPAATVHPRHAAAAGSPETAAVE